MSLFERMAALQGFDIDGNPLKTELPDRKVRLRGYQSGYGKLPGLVSRLRQFRDRLGQHDMPWFGMGLIADLELIMQLLTLDEYKDWLRTSGPEEHREFADEIDRLQLEVETVDDVAAHVEGLPAEEHALPGVETIEKLDERAKVTQGVRDLLSELGIADDQTTDDELVPLLRALLS